MGKTSLIHELIDALQEQRIALSQDELADVFWLAARLPLRAPAQRPGAERSEASPAAGLDPKSRKPSERPADGGGKKDAAEGEKGRPGSGGGSAVPGGAAAAQVYTTRRRDDQAAAGKAGVPLRAPAAPALPHALELARTFRPLMRRVPSRTVQVLDEDATVERIAEQRIWATETRPARERWLEVALVVDATLSMAVWKPTLDELRLLLEQQGAFRDVRVWRVNTHTAGSLRLSAGAGPGRALHSAAELNDPHGRRLILLASDGVGDGWHDGRVKQLLEEWARHGPVAVVQMLPLSLWRQTGLAASPVVTVRASGAGLPSALLEVVDRWQEPELPSAGVPKPVPVPVFALEPAFVRAWAELTAGGGGDTATALLLESWEPEPPEEPEAPAAGEPPVTEADARLAAFDAMASPLARELAGVFAAVPLLRLPVLRLVQREMLPESGQTELAEVVLGGLLRAVNPAAEPDELEFAFHPGVRAQLLDSILVTDAIEVYNAASRYVESQLGQLRDFQAVIEDPTGQAAESLALENQPFAAIHAELLRRLGGRYANLADSIERLLPGPGPGPGPTPTGPDYPPKPQVGVDDYALLMGPDDNTAYFSREAFEPWNDVSHFARWLTSAHGGRLLPGNVDHITMYRVRSETYPVIVEKIQEKTEKWTRNRTRPGRRIYIYYSGAVFRDGTTQRYDVLVPARDDSGYVSIELTEIAVQLARIHGFQEVVVLMECSGAEIGEAGAEGIPRLSLGHDLPRPSEVKLFYAYSLNRSMELFDKLRNRAPLDEPYFDLFTRAVVRGLAGDAADAQGRVMTHDLAQFVSDFVKAEAAPEVAPAIEFRDNGRFLLVDGVEPPATWQPPVRDRWAMLIDVGPVGASGESREGSSASLLLVGETLLRLGYAEDQVLNHYHVNATREAILQTLAWLRSRAHPEDLLFLYYSGTGLRDASTGELGLFVPASADGANDGFLPLASMLDAIRGGPRVFLVFEVSEQEFVWSAREAVRDAAFLAGGTHGPVSFGSGLLTYELLRGLSGDALRSDGSVTIAGLIDWVVTRCAQTARESQGARFSFSTGHPRSDVLGDPRVFGALNVIETKGPPPRRAPSE